MAKKLFPVQGFAQEEWREIPSYEGYYAASSLGRIKRLKSIGPGKAGHILRPVKDACGYERVKLSVKSSCYTGKVHRLVAYAFLGISALEVNHKNGVRSDNRLENLEYLTHAENCKYSGQVLGNYSKTGASNPNAKIHAITAVTIRFLSESGFSGVEISNALGASKHIVYSVIRGETWQKSSSL